MTEIVTALVLIAHLLCVNLAAGGPLLCVWLEWRGDALAMSVARPVGRWSLATLAIGGLLGLALGCLKWRPDYADLWLGPLRYKLVWGVAEILFSLGLAISYWLLSRGCASVSQGMRFLRGSLALLSSTNLLYHFPPLFIVAGQLEAAGMTTGPQVRGAAFRQLMVAGETPALTIHVALASLAAAGGLLIWIGLRWQTRQDPAVAATVAGWGGRWALVPTLAQLPVGLWTLAVLPASAQSRLMGSDAGLTLLFLGSMVAALWLMRELAAVALGETTRPALVRSLVAMVLVVSLMTAMQRALQAGTLRQQSGEIQPGDDDGGVPWRLTPPARQGAVR